MSTPRFLVGTSHKTYFSNARALSWTAAVAELCRTHPAVTGGAAEVFVLPTHLALPGVLATVRAVGSPLVVGAQDAAATGPGPHTGDVTAAEIAEVGGALVAVGHAERRRDHGEDDLVVAAKVAAVLRAGMLPLLCVGEPEQGSPEDAALVCADQVRAAVQPAREQGLTGEIAVAYEPVWAIGAARPASPEHIRVVCRHLRTPEGSGRVIYGGSAGPGLLAEIAEDTDGLFLGRRAHDPDGLRAVLDEVSDVVRAGSAHAGGVLR